MYSLFNKISYETCKLVTTAYSTSFSIGARCLHPSIRNAIYSIYGFVRLADEIVDTFDGHDRETLLREFEEEYYKALHNRISMNPIVHSFQKTVHTYDIDDELIQTFLRSMKSDLYQTYFDEDNIKDYIHGSAEVVGLMCLKVFVKGNNEQYLKLKPYAIRLGAALQKVNFLRDLQHDTNNLHRIYFPVLKNQQFDETVKRNILSDIYQDYKVALEGIRMLPKCARLGVYTAFLYYKQLTKQIEHTPAAKLLKSRIRVSNAKKLILFGQAYLAEKFI